MGRSELSKKFPIRKLQLAPHTTPHTQRSNMNSIVIRRGLNTFNSLRLQRHLAVAKAQLEPVGLDVVECEYRSNQWCASLPLNGLTPDDLALTVQRETNSIQVQLADTSNMVRLALDAKVDSIQARVIDEQLIICVDLIDELDAL